MGKHLSSVSVITLLLLFSASNAKIWYVHPDSTLSSIQAGLDSCLANDTVLVALGTYHEHLVWPTVVGMKLFSESGYDSTTIDGDSTGRIITMPASFLIDSTTEIKGFTLRKGFADWGGAISSLHASPKIADNNLINNYALYFGGAIYSDDANLVICGNVISYNHAMDGGGIFCLTESKSDRFTNKSNRVCTAITNNIICDNEADYGGGISCTHEGASIANNTIQNNHALFGGGIFGYLAEGGIVSENVITYNSADSIGGGIYYMIYMGETANNTIAQNRAGIIGDGIYCRDGNFLGLPMSYNNIYNNGSGLYNNPSSIDATCNWWGDATGPYHPILNPNGLGDTVSDYVDFVPWLPESVGIKEAQNFQIVASNLGISPNPFRGHADIIWQGTSNSAARIAIYDISGRLIRQFDHLTNQPFNQIAWNGCDNTGTKLPTGIYFLKFVAGDYKETKKLLLLR